MLLMQDVEKLASKKGVVLQTIKEVLQVRASQPNHCLQHIQSLAPRAAVHVRCMMQTCMD